MFQMLNVWNMYPAFGCCISMLEFGLNSMHFFLYIWNLITICLSMLGYQFGWWTPNHYITKLSLKITKFHPCSIHWKTLLGFRVTPYKHVRTYGFALEKTVFFQVDVSMVSPPLFPKTMSVCNVSPTSNVTIFGGRAPRRDVSVVTWWSDHTLPIFYKPFSWLIWQGSFSNPRSLRGLAKDHHGYYHQTFRKGT